MSLERMSDLLVDGSHYENNISSPNSRPMLKKSIGKKKKNKNIKNQRLLSLQKMISKHKRFYDQPPTPHNTTQYIINEYETPRDLYMEEFRENQYSDYFGSMIGLFDADKKSDKNSVYGCHSSKSTSCSDSEFENKVKFAKFERNPTVLLEIIESLKNKNKQIDVELMDLERKLSDSL